MQCTDQDEHAEDKDKTQNHVPSVSQPFGALYLPKTVPSFFTRNFAKFQEIGLVSPLAACRFDSWSQKSSFL